MKKYCLALDLVDDAELIREYENFHKAENERKPITESIRSAGITNFEIFRTGNRLFTIMETTDDFDPARKAEMDAANPHVQEWEALMWKYQKPLPWAAPGEKWVLMEKIYELPK